MADIISCGYTSDVITAEDACAEKSSGVVAMYLTNFPALGLGTTWDNDTETFTAAPTVTNASTNNKLVKLDVDPDTISYKWTTTNGKTYVETLEFDSMSISPQKMFNWRRVAVCCGAVVYLVLTSGDVIVVGLQPDASGVITRAKKPMKPTEFSGDMGLGSDDNGNQKVTFKWEATSTYGPLFLNFASAAADLENLA